MARTTIGIGVLLIVIGLIGYFGSGRVSVTALIPAFFGTPIALLGTLSLRESRRKACVHAAVVLGVLGAGGAGSRSLPNIGALLSGEAESAFGTSMQLLMFVVCLVFVALCVRSFIAARRAQ
ncbi:MAG: hypothetical protein VX681_02485 [Myxococcota bacterium]|nr:hypothetical protein [Myxococcota bacterium]